MFHIVQSYGSLCYFLFIFRSPKDHDEAFLFKLSRNRNELKNKLIDEVTDIGHIIDHSTTIDCDVEVSLFYTSYILKWQF